jgi:hypothetical protein
MAQAFLKALGFDGEIGTITVDMKGRPRRAVVMWSRVVKGAA